jgi:hypothetical protein
MRKTGGLLAVLWLTLGCDPQRCWEAADPSARYAVDLVDLYNAQSRFKYFPAEGDSYVASGGSCAGIDGVAPGASLQLQATGETDDRSKSCRVVTANLTAAPAALTLSGSSSNAAAMQDVLGRAGFMYALEDVVVAGCSGTLVLKLFHSLGAGDLYAAPVDGQPPTVILYRLFLPAPMSTPASAGCSPCDDNFVVKVSKA